MLPREGKQQTCVSESALPKCFGAKLCILVSFICIFGSPKSDATFGDDFKGGGGLKIYLHKATWVRTMSSRIAQSCTAHETS